tara:strand:- start:2013 stop:2693 length:681 start_codon:yes stop_codon:yes gene_type:complete
MLFFLAASPPLFIIYKIYQLDKYEKEPIRPIILTFVFGISTVLPILFVATVRDLFYGNNFIEKIELSIFLYALIGVALLEEIFKYLVLKKYCLKLKEFNEPMDGIVYGVVVSMGFAFAENLMYVFIYANDYALSVAILRMFSAIPAHALMGVFMGYYIGKAKFSIKQEKNILLFKSLFGAVLLHGLYDYFLMSNLNISLFAFISLLISFYIAKKAIRESQESSPFK